MTKEITITVKSPIDCTEEQFDEWIKFCLHYNGGMSIENPLHEYDFEATNINL
jgi:hypothetical protein